jgi:hypothetical protein
MMTKNTLALYFPHTRPLLPSVPPIAFVLSTIFLANRYPSNPPAGHPTLSEIYMAASEISISVQPPSSIVCASQCNLFLGATLDWTRAKQKTVFKATKLV